MKVIYSILLLWCFSYSILAKKNEPSLLWWQSEVIYQIYPRSFKDSNEDGIGDLKGIYQKLPYIKKLGIGAIWLSPIFASPMVDFGYDISNYRVIEPIFGSMNDFEILLKKARKLGIKVLLDFVPNHTSDKHEWFQKSVNRIPPYTNYYIWKDAKYVNNVRQPPNNWLSAFGKTAWEWNKERGQYYLHQFAIEQPDLDYRNPVVYEEMKNILIYWLDKGVDGFRIDAFNFLFENSSFLDEPRTYKPFVKPDEFNYLDHIYTQNQPETFKVAQDWRSIIDNYSKRGQQRFIMTEAYAPLSTVMKFYGTESKPGSHFPFNFMMFTSINVESNSSSILYFIKNWFDNMPKHGWANWVLGNHDNPRPATRFGHYLIDGLHMLQMLLPGTAVVYNGDELGMEDTFIRWDQSVDPCALYAGPLRYKATTRDPARTPFQWDSSLNAGFTKSLHTWLPVNPGYWKLNVKTESNISSGKTHLKIFKDLVKLRKNIVFQKGNLHMYAVSEWVLVIVRSYVDHATYIIVINFGSDITISDLLEVRPSLPDKLGVVIPSVNSKYKTGDVLKTNEIKLRPKAAVVLTTSEEDWEVSDNGKIDLKHEVFAPSNEILHN